MLLTISAYSVFIWALPKLSFGLSRKLRSRSSPFIALSLIEIRALMASLLSSAAEVNSFKYDLDLP